MLPVEILPQVKRNGSKHGRGYYSKLSWIKIEKELVSLFQFWGVLLHDTVTNREDFFFNSPVVQMRVVLHTIA